MPDSLIYLSYSIKSVLNKSPSLTPHPSRAVNLRPSIPARQLLPAGSVKID